MTTRNEEMDRLIWTEDFLKRIAYKEKYMPKAVREEARRILRHYPGPTRIRMLYGVSDEPNY